MDYSISSATIQYIYCDYNSFLQSNKTDVTRLMGRQCTNSIRHVQWRNKIEILFSGWYTVYMFRWLYPGFMPWGQLCLLADFWALLYSRVNHAVHKRSCTVVQYVYLSSAHDCDVLCFMTNIRSLLPGNTESFWCRYQKMEQHTISAGKWLIFMNLQCKYLYPYMYTVGQNGCQELRYCRTEKNIKSQCKSKDDIWEIWMKNLRCESLGKHPGSFEREKVQTPLITIRAIIFQKVNNSATSNALLALELESKLCLYWVNFTRSLRPLASHT